MTKETRFLHQYARSGARACSSWGMMLMLVRVIDALHFKQARIMEYGLWHKKYKLKGTPNTRTLWGLGLIKDLMEE